MLTETPGRSLRQRNRTGSAAAAGAARALLAAALCGLLAGCYVLQAATGEYRLLHARTPIAALIADPKTPSVLRERR